MVYIAKLFLSDLAFYHVQIRNATKELIKLSENLGYDRQAKSKVWGPWDEEQIKRGTDN
jgi:hypothetical protein